MGGVDSLMLGEDQSNMHFAVSWVRNGSLVVLECSEWARSGR